MYNIITANMRPKGVYSSHNDIYVSNINFNFTFGIFNDYFCLRSRPVDRDVVRQLVSRNVETNN